MAIASASVRLYPEMDLQAAFDFVVSHAPLRRIIDAYCRINCPPLLSAQFSLFHEESQ